MITFLHRGLEIASYTIVMSARLISIYVGSQATNRKFAD